MNPPASAPPRPPARGARNTEPPSGKNARNGTSSPQSGPGGPWPPQPRRIKHRRTLGDLLRGLGSFLVLAVLLGAIPFALVRYIGWPLPHHLPSSSTFNQAITPTVLLDVLAVVVWLAWAQFAACVVVEFAAAVRGVGMPARVPAAGHSQLLARQLIAALLMLTASAASFVPDLGTLGGHSAALTPVTPPAISRAYSPALRPVPPSGLRPAALNSAMTGPVSATADTANLPVIRAGSGVSVVRTGAMSLAGNGTGSDGTKLYRVEPPEGRHHDSLWGIAQRYLGDGRRYNEIFMLNKDRVQPDGSKLTIASLIRPGWILVMPADASGGDLVVEAPVPTIPSSPVPPPATPPTTPPTTSPGSPTTPAPTPTPSSSASASTSTSPTGAPTGSGPSTAPTAPPNPPTATAPTSLTPVPSTAPPTVPPPSRNPAPSSAPATSLPATRPPASTPATTAPAAPNTSAGQPQGAIAAAAGPGLVGAIESVAKLPPAVLHPSSALPAVVQQGTNHQATSQQGTNPQNSTPQNSNPQGSGTQNPAQQPSSQQGSQQTPTQQQQSQQQSANLAGTSGQGSNQGSNPAGTPGSASGSTPASGTVATTRDAPRSSHRGAPAAEESQAPHADNRALYGLAAAPLLAAGLLKALGRHRRRQLWHRAFGRRPATASGDAALAEESIRIGAGEIEVWFLDLALRGMAASLAARGRTAPDVYGLKLRDEGIELMLTRPAAPRDPVQPPDPWFLAADRRSWNFPRPRIRDVDAQAAQRTFSPYPGMVTLGAAGADRVMVDLEEAHGVIAVDGPRELRRAAVAAIAVELATNSWSDRMTVTLVGFQGDLSPLAPARIRHVRTLDEVLPSLQTEARERAKALAAAGLDSVLDGRCRTSQASSFPPHFVLVAEEPHPALLTRLADAAAGTHRVGMGFVVAGSCAQAAWSLEVGEDGRISAPALGVDAVAQLLPDDQYTAVLGLFKAVADVEGTELPDAPEAAGTGSVGYTGPLPDRPPAVFASVLGTLDVTGTRPVEADRELLLREALVYLLHHRDGVHPRVLASALWPRGASADVAEATFERLATWLGEDPDGGSNLLVDGEGRLRLGRFVWSDWDLFQSLQSRALYDGSPTARQQREVLLAAALDLVRGPYLADREPGHYGWLAHEITEAQIPALVADTALRVADAKIAAGKAQSAIDAVKAGMRGSPEDEELWRGLVRATAATGDRRRLEGVVEELYRRTWYLHGVKGLHPRTEALVEELLPGWRDVVSA